MASNHPLPTQPGQQQQRPRAKSAFSFHSHKSAGSNGHNKLNLTESHEEKESRRLHSKADPSMALSEAEPSAVATGAGTSLAPIRAIQHRDSQGNPIADPDRSNPTRSRWERPLDTIRSFEAAIDGNYRKSFIRTDSSDTVSNYGGGYNRRSSYFGGAQDDRPRYAPNGGRPMSHRPESTYADNRYNRAGRPDSYFAGENSAGPSHGYYPNRARYPRTASEPQFNNNHGVYPVPGNQQSYETVTTASGSGSDPIGYSTDPSSENSSVDRIPQQVPQETYGFSGFGATPQFVPPGSDLNGQSIVKNYSTERPANSYPQQGPPVPNKLGKQAPMKLGETSGNAGPPPAQRPEAGEKRKSWLGKRFSKSK